MNDGYIQYKQRELGEKINTLLEKVDVLGKKIEHINNKSEEFNQLLSEIKKEKKHQENIKKELAQETKQIINEMIPKVRSKLHKKIETDFDKHQENSDKDIEEMKDMIRGVLSQTNEIMHTKLQVLILTYLLHKQGIIDKKEMHTIKDMEEKDISKNREIMEMLTEIRNM